MSSLSMNSKKLKPPCNCKNSCQRGSGEKRAGCPCQDHESLCTEECQCGTERWPCKNRPCHTPPCHCQNSCQKGSGKKRVGCPCQDHHTKCTKQCHCGTEDWPCQNKASDCNEIDENDSKEHEEKGKVNHSESGFKHLKPPCKCQNSCQRGSGDKRVGCPCQDHDTVCTEDCQCGTNRWPCENRLSESDGAIGGVFDRTTGKQTSVKAIPAMKLERAFTLNNAYVSVLNNVKFQDGSQLTERIGSEKDVKNIKGFFESRGFHVETKENLEYLEIESYFAKLTKGFSRRFPYDGYICFLMSHGQRSKVYGTDGNTLEIDMIVSRFMNCDNLRGKPKLFFIQACRSSKIMSDGHKEDDEDHDIQRSLHVPKQADVLVAHSTFDGLHAYRTRENGSWFISTLMKELTEHAHDKHLMDMLTSVNAVVATEKSRHTHLQVPTQLNSLTKPVYFNQQ